MLPIAMKFIDALMAWIIAIAGVFALNTWGGVPQSMLTAILFDVAVLSCFFLVWGVSILGRTWGGEPLYDTKKSIVMPLSICVSAVITLLLERIGSLGEVAYLQGSVFLITTIVIENRLEKSLTNERHGHPFDALLRFILIGSFAVSIISAAGLLIYGRLRAFNYIREVLWLDSPSLFLFNSSFSWILEYV